MLMRIVAVAGIAALLGGCAGAPPLVLPPVRDASLPGAGESAPDPEPPAARTLARAPARNDRSAPRLEDTSGRAGILRPRPAKAPPGRLDESGTGAAVAPRVGEETPKEVVRETREEMTRRAGTETAGGVTRRSAGAGVEP